MREDHDLSADKPSCYRKIQTLGAKGGLWVVRESVTGKTFVMRKLSRENREVYERLMSIRHPNVVRVLHVFSDKGTFYGVEEYVQGRSLFCILTQRGTFGSKVISVGEQILRGLSVLHKNGIIHRDIKPENVMMDERGKVKLIDFHIARVFYGEKERDTMLKGTKGYASPEQFGYRQTDCRTDIYSLGVTLNELAVGKLPGEERCKGGLGVFIHKCTEFDPKRRFQTAQEALRRLKWLEKGYRLGRQGRKIMGKAIFKHALGTVPAVQYKRGRRVYNRG